MFSLVHDPQNKSIQFYFMTQKNILVVGGSTGIGLALVAQLAGAGHQVLVWSRHAGELEGMPGVTHLSVDVAQDELPALPAALDGLVYCPGSINLKPFKSLGVQQFQADFELNVLGAVRCLQAAEGALKKGSDPAVVLFSTVAVKKGMAFHASIAAAKGAVEGLAKSLAAEWAPAVRVNAIAPSLTDTPLAERLLSTEDKRRAAADRHPLKRVGTAAEIASLAAYLLSPAAGFITGQVIGADGGMGSL
jgi:NAD(P)-dependent dehydrogenase (short-subunit alcohol dehydrogenase family)